MSNPVLSNETMQNNKSIKTIFPKVISASRATDIPACHSDWFMERLGEGQCEWQNPFNANQRQIVSFAETEVFVFWSKNPSPLVPYLKEIEDKGKKFYFQFTLNDYDDEGLEPGIPALEERIKIFTDLGNACKVIWRYDPVILGDRLTVVNHMRKLEYLMKAVGDSTDKLVFSFVDLYGRVSTNLKRHNSEYRAPTLEEMKEFSQALAELRDKINPALKLATCAEADINLANLGIEKNSCIDPVLINQLSSQEIFPKKKITVSQAQLFSSAEEKASPPMLYEKDKGQRKACQCAPSKDIGSYLMHPCGHRCVYCYAGHARKSF